MKQKTFPTPAMPTGASPSGSHYTNLFKCCPYKFLMRYIYGWKPLRTSSALLNGSAFHYVKAVFYATGKKSAALAALTRFLVEVRKEYETEEELSLARLRLPSMISAWIEKYGFRDLERYTFLEIEQEHSVPLLGGFSFTLRLDALVRDKERNLLILETKTSSWRPELAEIEVVNGDQASAYIACVSELYKTKPSRVFLLPDICSWPKNSRKVSQINCYRGEFVQRDSNALEEWKIGTSNELAELSQKASALKTHSPYALFRRNTFYCTAWARPCEYLNVCRQRFEKNHVPYGFKKDTQLPDLFPAAKGKKK